MHSKKQRRTREKQQETQKEERNRKKRKTERINKKKENKRVGSEVRKTKVLQGIHQQAAPFSPFQQPTLYKLNDQILNHLGPFFQSKQFRWQDFPMRLPTLEIGSLLGLKSVKKPSSAD